MNRLLTLAAFLFAAPAFAEDWPRWRGPRGDGSWNAPTLPEKWPSGGPKVLWKRPIGGGYAGITTADGRLFTLDLKEPINRSAKTGPDGTERVLCFDAKTGDVLWSHAYPVRYGDLGGYANGPRSAPTVHEGKLYALGAVGHLFCFEAATGKIVWQRDTVKECGARVPMWGFAASPLIDGERVIVHLGAEPGGCFIAFDRNTGKEVWRSGADEAGYATPILVRTPSGRQLLAWTPERILGMNPDTGAALWKVPHKVTYGVSITTPIYYDDVLFVSEYWNGSKAIRLGPSAPDHQIVWQDSKTLRGLMVPPLYRNGFVYAIDKEHGITCFELKTGKKRWDDENRLTPAGRNPHLSMTWINNTHRVLILNAVGELILARFTPDGVEEQSRAKVLNGRVWSQPGFADRHLFARTDGGENWQRATPLELICVELAK